MDALISIVNDSDELLAEALNEARKRSREASERTGSDTTRCEIEIIDLINVEINASESFCPPESGLRLVPELRWQLTKTQEKASKLQSLTA